MSGFKVVSRTEAEIPFRVREEPRDGTLVFGSADGFDVALPIAVVDALHGHGRRAAPDEFLGLVYGRILRDESGEHATVDGIVPVVGARATRASVVSTPQVAAAAEARAAELYPHSRRLGWCHSHPHYGTEFSSTDRGNQATYGPLGIGIVVDPWEERDHGLAVYLGPRSEKLRLASAKQPRDLGERASFSIRRPLTGNARGSLAPQDVRARLPYVAAFCVASSLALTIGCAIAVASRIEKYDEHIYRLDGALAELRPPAAVASTPQASSGTPSAIEAPPAPTARVCKEPGGP